jgi:O-antigen/teichoic acid export membrane protein
MSAPEVPKNLTGTVVRGAGFSGVGFVVSRVLNLAAFVVLARLVTPDELGHYAAGTILVGIGLLLSDSGMSAAVIHRRDRLEEAASTAVIATVAAGAGISLLALAVSPLIGDFFGSSTVAAVAAVSSGLLFLQSARSVPNALLQRRFSFLRRIVVEPVAAIAFGAGAIVATASGLGVWGLVIGLYAQVVTDFALSWALVQWRPRLKLVSFEMWRELVAYGRHVLAGALVRRLGEQIPVAVIGRFVGSGALGQFQYAIKMVGTPYGFLLAGTSYVLFPAFARISDERLRFEVAFLRSLRWMAVTAIPVGFLLLPLGKPLAIVLFGPRWADAGQAAAALCLFIPGRALASVIGEAFRGSGRPRDWTRVNVVAVIGGAVAMFALLPFGLIGVSAGLSVDAVVTAGYAIARARRTMGVPINVMLARIWPPAVAALAMAGVLAAVETLLVHAASHGTVLGLLLLLAEGALALLVYVLGLRLIAPDMALELRSLLLAARKQPNTRPTAETRRGATVDSRASK